MLVTNGDDGSVVLDVAVAEPPRGRSAGPTALLLHGFPQTARCWSDLTPLLTGSGLRVLAPDQRGYSPGGRPTEAAAYALEHLVSDALAVLDAAEVTDAVVVGHDWGALVGWTMAARHPERVRGLVALSVPHPRAMAEALAGDADQRRRSSYVELFRREGAAEDALLAGDGAGLRLLYAGARVAEERIDAHVADLRDRSRLTGALSWYRAMDLSELAAVEPVTVPTTFVWGARDPAVGSAAVAACGRWVTGKYRLVTLPDATHWLPEEAAAVLAELVVGRTATHDPVSGNRHRVPSVTDGAEGGFGADRDGLGTDAEREG